MLLHTINILASNSASLHDEWNQQTSVIRLCTSHQWRTYYIRLSLVTDLMRSSYYSVHGRSVRNTYFATSITLCYYHRSMCLDFRTMFEWNALTREWSYADNCEALLAVHTEQYPYVCRTGPRLGWGIMSYRTGHCKPACRVAWNLSQVR
jgi:hypothetical protein